MMLGPLRNFEYCYQISAILLFVPLLYGMETLGEGGCSERHSSVS